MVELFIKRENWDGGIWMELPVNEETVKRVIKELEEKDSSNMVPFIGGVKSPVRGLDRFLIGEFAFWENHPDLLNQLAEKINSWDEKQCAIFEAALRMEIPKSIFEVFEVTKHLDQYVLHSDVVTPEQLGYFILDREQQSIPLGLADYFDYEHYGFMNMKHNDMMTAAGLVVKREDVECNMCESQTDPDRVLANQAVFQLFLSSDKPGNGYLGKEEWCLELPATDSELEHLQNQMNVPEITDVTDYRIRSQIPYLPDYLPPSCTIGELNQAAKAIREVSDRLEMSRKKLLASLEAEVPRDIDAVCRVIRNHGDYEFLPIDDLSPEEFAKYILRIHHVAIEPRMEIFYDLKEFGRQKMRENGPVNTYYGVLINKVRPIPQINADLQEFRFYNSLALTAYWNDRDSTLPVILGGETAILYKAMIQEKINKSLSDCSERGLAMYLSNELLGRRIFTMHPSVEECGGELWGVLTVKTYGELNQRELEALREEWRTMADGGWGEDLFYRPILTKRGEIYIGFWDTDNNDNLFIKTEDEFKREFPDGIHPGQPRGEVTEESESPFISPFFSE